jgi:HAD superfamily hydrolase (TIGR01450 family)
VTSLPAPSGSWLAGCPTALASAYDAGLLDLDGVVYLGQDEIPGAAPALAAARGLGMRMAFVTNNASRTPEAVAAHLRELGIPAAADKVATAAQAAARVLREHLPDGVRVLVVGGDGLVAAVRQAGFEVVTSADDRPAAVVLGYRPTTTYADLAEAALAIRAGALWVAANRDATMPTPRGQVPGTGALVALLVEATGQTPIVAGKPELALHREAVARVGAQRPLVVGDRLDTDIAGATAVGCDSLLVLTGVTSLADLRAAPPGLRPTYLSADLSGLLRSHPHVVVSGAGAQCARLDDDVDDGLDDARAAVALAWARADG